MTDYPYQPPEREYASTITAFRDFTQASTWRVRIAPDPLGSVNKIVRLMRGERQIKATLARVPAGASVRLVRDEGGYRIEEVFALREYDWRSGEVVELPERRPPGWRVEVDGETVLAVTDAELQPPRPQMPRTPLWRRFRHWTARRARSAADGLAGRLGYHRNDECGGWGE